MRRFAVLLSALLLVCGLTACDDNGTPEGPGGGEPSIELGLPPVSETVPPSTTVEQGVPFGKLTMLSPTRGCSVSGDLEGQFTSSRQMPQYLECILPGIEEWIDATYSSMSSPTYYFVPQGVKHQEKLCPLDATALQYCPSNGSIFLGEASVWDQYTKHGDAAPAVILAHEVTHFFQHVLKMPPATKPNEQVRYENQADCGAGAFMAHSRNMRRLSLNDVEDLAGSLMSAAQSEQLGTKRDHGTIEERLTAFDLSYLNTGSHYMAACNVFVPEVPILTLQ